MSTEKNESQKEKDADETDNNVPHMSCRHYLLPIIILFVVLGTVCLNTSDTQYAYFALQRGRNISSEVSDSRQSLCPNTSSVLFKQQQEIQSEAARWNAYCHLASSAPALVMATMVGSWSDKIGRRYSLFIPTAGLLIKSGFFAVAIKYQWNIYLFPIVFFIEGLSGMWISVIASAYSFAADLTKYGKSRTFGIVLVEITLGLGVTTGAFSSGYLIKFIGFFYSSIVVCLLAFCMFILIFFLPESVQSRQKLTSISQIQYIRIAVSFYTKKSPLRWKYNVLICVFTLFVFTFIGRYNVQALYVLNSPFCWNSVYIGIFGASRSFVQMVIGVGLTKLMFLFLTENGMLIAGTISSLAAYMLTAVAVNDFMLFLTPVVGILGNVPVVLIRAMMSGMTPRDKQGSLFGGLAAMDAVCSLIGSVVSNFLYSETVALYSGTVWMLFAGLNAIALFLLGYMLLRERRERAKVDDKDKTKQIQLVHVVKL